MDSLIITTIWISLFSWVIWSMMITRLLCVSGHHAWEILLRLAKKEPDGEITYTLVRGCVRCREVDRRSFTQAAMAEWTEKNNYAWRKAPEETTQYAERVYGVKDRSG